MIPADDRDRQKIIEKGHNCVHGQKVHTKSHGCRGMSRTTCNFNASGRSIRIQPATSPLAVSITYTDVGRALMPMTLGASFLPCLSPLAFRATSFTLDPKKQYHTHAFAFRRRGSETRIHIHSLAKDTKASGWLTRFEFISTDRPPAEPAQLSHTCFVPAHAVMKFFSGPLSSPRCGIHGLVSYI